MSTQLLEWENTLPYVLTELSLTVLNVIILLIIAGVSAAVVESHLKEGRSFFTALRPFLQSIHSSSIAFVPTEGYPGEDKIDVVYNGYQEVMCQVWGKIFRRKFNVARLWVRLYFVILSGVIVMWTIAVFSSALLYEKSSTCQDVSVEDTDTVCFQLDHREDVPREIQEIIDRLPGELVPCVTIENFLSANNLTYDLEVICYQYQLDPVIALGVSYGYMKTATYAISVIISTILSLSNKCCNRKTGKTGCMCSRRVTKKTMVMWQIVLTLSAMLMLVVFAITIGLLHNLSATRNSSIDLLRGDTFRLYSQYAFFIPFTILFTIGLFPWWAFKPLENPPIWKTDGLTEKELSQRLNKIIHFCVLHERFSTNYIFETDEIILRKSMKAKRKTSEKSTLQEISSPEIPAIELAETVA